MEALQHCGDEVVELCPRGCVSLRDDAWAEAVNAHDARLFMIAAVEPRHHPSERVADDVDGAESQAVHDRLDVEHGVFPTETIRVTGLTTEPNVECDCASSRPK